jgi:hypothetical protein
MTQAEYLNKPSVRIPMAWDVWWQSSAAQQSALIIHGDGGEQ